MQSHHPSEDWHFHLLSMARTYCCIAADAALQVFQTTWVARRFVTFCSKYFASFSAAPFLVWFLLRSFLHQSLHLTYKCSLRLVLSTRRTVLRCRSLSALSWSSEALQLCIYFPFKRGLPPEVFLSSLASEAGSGRRSTNAQSQATRRLSWCSRCRAYVQSTCCCKAKDSFQSYLNGILGNSSF